MGDTRAQVGSVGVCDVELFDICQGFFIRVHVINPDEDHALFFVLSPGLLQVGSFFPSGWAP